MNPRSVEDVKEGIMVALKNFGGTYHTLNAIEKSMGVEVSNDFHSFYTIKLNDDHYVDITLIYFGESSKLIITISANRIDNCNNLIKINDNVILDVDVDIVACIDVVIKIGGNPWVLIGDEIHDVLSEFIEAVGIEF